MHCGPNLHMLHALLYTLGFVMILIILIYVELLIVYMVRMSRDKKLGFLLEKKQSIRKLCYKLLACIAILSGLLTYEVLNYNDMYLCINRLQEMELTLGALLVKWFKNLVLLTAYYWIFQTFVFEIPIDYHSELDKSLIRIDSRTEKMKSFSITNSDNIDLIF